MFLKSLIIRIVTFMYFICVQQLVYATDLSDVNKLIITLFVYALVKYFLIEVLHIIWDVVDSMVRN
jgi:hypothetical protein